MLRSSNEVFDAPSGDVTKCTRATPFVMPSPIAERLERAALLTLVHHCGLLAPAASAGAAELQAMMHSCGVEARAVRRHAQRLRNDAKNQLPWGASDEAFAKAGDWLSQRAAAATAPSSCAKTSSCGRCIAPRMRPLSHGWYAGTKPCM